MPHSNKQPIASETAYVAKIEDLVRDIITQHQLPFYRIESVSPGEQQSGPGKLYVIKVIAYFEDTVDKICALLHKEFDLNLISPEAFVGFELFSFRQISYTASLKTTDKSTEENNIHFEIEVCSLLHDVLSGYEQALGITASELPGSARKDIYRIGSMLEMADKEFCQLRNRLHPDEDTLALHNHQKPAAEEEEDSTIINNESLLAYVSTSKLLRVVDQMIALNNNATVTGHVDIDGDVERLRFLNIQTIKQLDDKLAETIAKAEGEK